MYDVIVVGGSYAGMAAALQLARGRRTVMVLDAGVRRNRFAHASHGLLGQDGKPPSDIVDEAKAQLLAYPTVTWLDGTAVDAEQFGEDFVVHTDNGESVRARQLVLATGVRDELPEIPGLQDQWGQSVFHCPYCHGYELDCGPLGVLATGEASLHQALIIPEWGPTTFFTNSVIDPDDEQVRQLQALNVTIERQRVASVSDPSATVHLADGRAIELAGLFVAPRVEAWNPLVESLGCELTDTPLGRIITVSETKETSVPRVFACGDSARAAGSLTFAISDGALAGLAAHRSLIFGELGQGESEARVSA